MDECYLAKLQQPFCEPTLRANQPVSQAGKQVDCFQIQV